jgi:hypothetical protein
VINSNAKGVKQDWFSAQNDAPLASGKFINLIKFLARRAAERDFEAWAALQNEEGKD